jgi:hypothetical protein
MCFYFCKYKQKNSIKYINSKKREIDIYTTTETILSFAHDSIEFFVESLTSYIFIISE